MPLYVHENGERVLPAVDSENERQLAAKAADPTSGWSEADDDGEPVKAPARAARGRAATTAPTTEGDA